MIFGETREFTTLSTEAEGFSETYVRRIVSESSADIGATSQAYVRPIVAESPAYRSGFEFVEGHIDPEHVDTTDVRGTRANREYTLTMMLNDDEATVIAESLTHQDGVVEHEVPDGENFVTDETDGHHTVVVFRPHAVNLLNGYYVAFDWELEHIGGDEYSWRCTLDIQLSEEIDLAEHIESQRVKVNGSAGVSGDVDATGVFPTEMFALSRTRGIIGAFVRENTSISGVSGTTGTVNPQPRVPAAVSGSSGTTGSLSGERIGSFAVAGESTTVGSVTATGIAPDAIEGFATLDHYSFENGSPGDVSLDTNEYTFGGQSLLHDSEDTVRIYATDPPHAPPNPPFTVRFDTRFSHPGQGRTEWYLWYDFGQWVHIRVNQSGGVLQIRDSVDAVIGSDGYNRSADTWYMCEVDVTESATEEWHVEATLYDGETELANTTGDTTVDVPQDNKLAWQIWNTGGNPTWVDYLRYVDSISFGSVTGEAGTTGTVTPSPAGYAQVTGESGITGTITPTAGDTATTIEDWTGTDPLDNWTSTGDYEISSTQSTVGGVSLKTLSTGFNRMESGASIQEITRGDEFRFDYYTGDSNNTNIRFFWCLDSGPNDFYAIEANHNGGEFELIYGESGPEDDVSDTFTRSGTDDQWNTIAVDFDSADDGTIRAKYLDDTGAQLAEVTATNWTQYDNGILGVSIWNGTTDQWLDYIRLEEY